MNYSRYMNPYCHKNSGFRCRIHCIDLRLCLTHTFYFCEKCKTGCSYCPGMELITPLKKRKIKMSRTRAARIQ